MSDKTVPAEADDYKDDETQGEPSQDRRVENDPLVEAAKSHKGEPPNRDEDEFSDKGLKAPDLEKEARKEADKASDNR